MKRHRLQLLTPAISILIVLLFTFGVATAEAKTPVNLPDSTMSIPWVDFQDILKKLSSTQIGPIKEKPPYDALISSADYTVQVKGHIALIRVRAEIVVLKEEGWSSVPVMKYGAHLDQVRLNGEPAALVQKSDGLLHVILDEPGIHILDLKYEAPLKDGGGPKYLNFPTLESPVNHLTVEISQPDQQVTLGDGKILKNSSTGAKTTATGSFKPGSEQTIRWAQNVATQARNKARVSAETNTMAVIGEGLVVYTSNVEFNIQHKPLRAFSIIFPEDVVVADVSTDGLVDWLVEKADGEQRLSVNIAYEAIGKHRVAVTYEQPLPSESDSIIETADIRIADVIRDAGTFAVAVRGNVQVDAKKTINLAPMDIQELPPGMRGDKNLLVLMAFKYILHPNLASLRVIRHKIASVLSCIVEKADYKIMLTERGKELMEATYQVANRTRQYLSLKLPKGMILWGAYRDGDPVHAAFRDGQTLLQISGADHRKSVELRLIAFREMGFPKVVGWSHFDLPILDVPVHNINLSLYLPQNYQFFSFGGNLGEVSQKGHSSDIATKSEIKKEKDKFLFGTANASGYTFTTSHANSQSTTYMFSDDDDAPVAGANLSKVLTNRALPVQFQTVLEGQHFSFSTRIVDPNETMYASVGHFTKIQSGLPKLIVFLAALFIGFVVIRYILDRAADNMAKVNRKHCLYAIIALALIVILSLISGIGLRFVLFAFVLGGLFPLVPRAYKYLEHRRKKMNNLKSRQPSKNTAGESEGGIHTPPASDPMNMASAENIPMGVLVEEKEDNDKETSTEASDDESPRGDK